MLKIQVQFFSHLAACNARFELKYETDDLIGMNVFCCIVYTVERSFIVGIACDKNSGAQQLESLRGSKVGGLEPDRQIEVYAYGLTLSHSQTWAILTKM